MRATDSDEMRSASLAVTVPLAAVDEIGTGDRTAVAEDLAEDVNHRSSLNPVALILSN
jgi:hypothetical protein